MGCGGSKDKDGNPNEIKFQMQTVGVAAADDFFKNVGDALESAEKIRKGAEDDKEEALELSHAYRLKDKGQRMRSAFQVLFWAISAGNGGDVKKTKLDIVAELPFLKFERDGNLHNDTNRLGEASNGFLEACANGPADLQNIITKLSEAAEKAPKLKDDCDFSGLGAMEKPKAFKNIAVNTQTLTKNLPKVKDLLPKVQDAAKDMKEIGPNLKNLVDTADETGKKAHESKKTTPSEIFDEFVKDGLLTDDEVKAERDAKDPKKKNEKKK